MLRRNRGMIVFMCDYCGEELETDERDFDEAREALREDEWKVRKEEGEWVHVCPLCQD